MIPMPKLGPLVPWDITRGAAPHDPGSRQPVVQAKVGTHGGVDGGAGPQAQHDSGRYQYADHRPYGVVDVILRMSNTSAATSSLVPTVVCAGPPSSWWHCLSPGATYIVIVTTIRDEQMQDTGTDAFWLIFWHDALCVACSSCKCPA